MSSGDTSDELFRSLGLAVSLSLLYVVFLSVFGPMPISIVWLPAVAVLLLFVSSLEFAFAVVVASLFIDFQISWFPATVWVAPLLFLPVFWRFRRGLEPGTSSPVNKALMWYGLSVIPSLLATEALWASTYRMMNVGAFLVVLYGTIASLRGKREFVGIVSLFFGMCLLNSLDVILESQILQRRSFGFAGIMFVDYAALGLCLAATIAILSRGIVRASLGLLASVFAVALILTQTRNAWASGAITLFFLAAYVLRFPARAGLSRSKAWRLVGIGVVVLSLSGGIAVVVNPGVEDRTIQIAQAGGDAPAVTQSGKVSSSLVSRALIWGTALNAFAAHPVTGIGLYAFPFVSRQYSTLPPMLYRKFVQNLTPHQTHIAVLAETGIIGFIGFVAFLFAVLRTAFRAVERAIDPVRRQIALVCLVATVYVVTSMFFTDAWMWGPLIVLFGMILGSTIANDNLRAQPLAAAGPGPTHEG